MNLGIYGIRENASPIPVVTNPIITKYNFQGKIVGSGPKRK